MCPLTWLAVLNVAEHGLCRLVKDRDIVYGIITLIDPENGE
jgi:hypothetical protein